MNADEKTADIVCQVAIASVPPSRRKVEVSDDVQISIMPTAIVLHDVEPESMSVLRKGDWTHVEWSGLVGEPSADLRARQITIEGANVRVIL